MNKLLGTALLVTTMSAVSIGALAAAANDVARETRSIDAKVSKVHLGSVIQLTLHQGATPSLVLSGDPRYVPRITTVQQGDTLTIGMQDTHMDGRHEQLRADLTVPNLQEFVAAGVGASEVSGFKGDHLTLLADGVGALRFTGQYRDVNAKRGGVGAMELNLGQAERVELNLTGTGKISATGQTKTLLANIGGVGGLDAQQLRAENVDLNMTGLGSASVTAKTAANVNLSGMGSATVYGNPAKRSGTASGFGKISWQ
jgi:hypothetical protein